MLLIVGILMLAFAVQQAVILVIAEENHEEWFPNELLFTLLYSLGMIAAGCLFIGGVICILGWLTGYIH